VANNDIFYISPETVNQPGRLSPLSTPVRPGYRHSVLLPGQVIAIQYSCKYQVIDSQHSPLILAISINELPSMSSLQVKTIHPVYFGNEVVFLTYVSFRVLEYILQLCKRSQNITTISSNTAHRVRSRVSLKKSVQLDFNTLRLSLAWRSTLQVPHKPEIGLPEMRGTPIIEKTDLHTKIGQFYHFDDHT
jgi:hypothetical protein